MTHPLPAQAFKSGRSLSQALSLLSRHQAEPAAHAIATAINQLHLDYAAKLELIHAAQQHPLFQHQNLLRRYLSNLMHTAYYLVNFLRKTAPKDLSNFESTAQKVLRKTKTSLINSRDKIILC